MKIIANILQILALLGILAIKFFLPNLPEVFEYIYVAYYLLVVLTLPSIMAKLFFRAEYFGFTSALMFLVYPAIYLLNWLISTQLGLIDYLELAGYIGIGLVVYWHYLLIFIISLKSKTELRLTLKLLPLLVLPILIYLVVVFLPFRQVDSVVALDYLQHAAVANQMAVREDLCLQPVDCSNLFLQPGYTTFFHTLWAAMIQGSGSTIQTVGYLIDVIFPLVMGAVFLKIALKATKGKKMLSVFAVTVGLLVFENQAYTTQLFLPQTFTFLLFLMMISSSQLSLWKVLIGSLLLTASHFVMGPFLIVQLGVFSLLRWLDRKPKRLHNTLKNWGWLIILAVIFIVIMNISGFSIERNFQTAATDALGSITNAYYPQNLWQYLGVLGFAWIILLPTLWYNFRKKNLELYTSWAILGLSVATISFFLAPTYAGKFLIGFGFYVGILLAQYLRELKFNLIKYISIILILLSITSSAFVNYREYIKFYDQVSGLETSEIKLYSAFVERDRELIDFLQARNNFACTMISDPYTQIVIASQTNYETINAQYMPLDVRADLFELVENPNTLNLEQLLESPEVIKYEPVCFVYSYRLLGSEQENGYWLGNVYNSKLTSKDKISEEDKFVDFMQEEGYEVKFSSEDHVVLVK